MKLKWLGRKLTLIIESLSDGISLSALQKEIVGVTTPYPVTNSEPKSISIDLNQLKATSSSGFSMHPDTMDTDTIELIGSIGQAAQWCSQQGVKVSLTCSSPKLLNLLMTSNIQHLCRLEPFHSGCPQNALLS
jgi:hypothetical protein